MIRKRMVEKPLEKMPLYYKRIKEYFDIIMIHSSLAVGQFFPKYGMAGVEPIKEYIVNNKIDLDPDTLGVDFLSVKRQGIWRS